MQIYNKWWDFKILLQNNLGKLPIRKFNFKLFFSKFIIATQILFHIAKYYVEKLIFNLYFKLTDEIHKRELLSILFIITFSFFFYYFIVIELSILLFGYSLLCYRFLFLFIAAILLFSWWLEVEFIKTEMTLDHQAPLKIWVDYYKGSNPLSFKDYITNYSNKPFFWHAIYNKYWTDIEDGWLALFTFFFFLLFFFIYSCSYRFDPRFVTFVSKYFFPVINFFETRWNPRLEDFISAPVRFWNWLVAFLEATQAPDSKYLKLIKKLPKPSTELEDEANWQWGQKTSLWKTARFSDIFFLRSVKLHKEMNRLVFDVEAPTITAVRFDPNWKIFFLRYTTSQFLASGNNFWKKYFINDLYFWNLISGFQRQVNRDVDNINNFAKNSFHQSNYFINTPYESFLSENYFSENFINTNPLFERFGWARDMYDNLAIYNDIPKKQNTASILSEIFTTPPTQTRNLTFSELRFFNKKYKEKYFPDKNNYWYSKLEKYKIKGFTFFGLDPTLIPIFFRKSFHLTTGPIPLYQFSNLEFLNSPHIIDVERYFSNPLTAEFLLELINHYNYRMASVEEQLGLLELPFWVGPSDPLTLGYITAILNSRIVRLENALQQKGFIKFIQNKFPSFEEWNFLRRKYLKFSNFTFTLEWKSVMNQSSSVSAKKTTKKTVNFNVPTSQEIKNFLIIEEKLRKLERQFSLNSATDLPTFSWRLFNLKENFSTNSLFDLGKKYLAQRTQMLNKNKDATSTYSSIILEAQKELDYKNTCAKTSGEDSQTLINIEKENTDFYRGLHLHYYSQLKREEENNLNFIPTLAPDSIAQNLRPRVYYPWYLWTLKYFGQNEERFVLPGFIWHYMPTPYPTTFSTFGSPWLSYQFFWKNVSSTIVGVSDSIAELKNSTPVALYSGVEAIMYIKPFLKIFDIFTKIFVKFITYPIEAFVTQTLIPYTNSLISLGFFIHLLWFIHFYIYIFIAAYVFFYAALYFHRKVGFLWFYEWMFEENFFSQYTNPIYWHSISDIWLNYKTPEQFYLFALHTNLLLHYTFFNYDQFFFFQTKWIRPIINLLVKLSRYSKPFWNLSVFKKFVSLGSYNNLDSKLLKSFYNARVKKYILLLFNGGSDCSVDHLIWNYFDYLAQVSHYLSRGVWKNLSFKNPQLEINALIKQFTMLLTSMSTQAHYFFMPTPLLDTILSWKLLTSIINQVFTTFFDQMLGLNTNKNLLMYVFYLGFSYDFNLKYYNSTFEIYKIFENKYQFFLSKLNSTAFWDTKEYWFLIFFRSFRFVPKIQFPFLNLHWSHEVNRLWLARIAYANSWIGQSTYVWPFFNIVQHLWWTSKLWVWAFGLVNTTLFLNHTGIGILDNVWNFFEKRYPNATITKIETIFGFVWSLNLSTIKHIPNYGPVPAPNKNFDLSFPEQLLDKWTTSWSYTKTNPPLDLCELGFTPNYLINLINKLAPKKLSIYLSFLNQLDYLDSNFELVNWNLNKEFWWLTFYEDLVSDVEHDFSSQYEFYFKWFDFDFRQTQNKPLCNWIFTFDVSYFLSHFTTWDYFNTSKSEVNLETRPNHFLNSQSFFTTQTLNLFFNNLDMLAWLNVDGSWFQKPFGSLDKFELHAIRKFKTLKTLDTHSLTRYRLDPFLNLDKEHTLSQVGLSLYPKSDKKNLAWAYSEEYAGSRGKRFPYNPTMVKNSTQPILLGWVGEIYNSTLAATNLLYSLTFASPSADILAWDDNNSLDFYKLLLGGWYFFLKTFFFKNDYHAELLSRAFLWLNLLNHPASYRYSFGPKALAWQDYWSWKCGFVFDYQNGLYSYRPYLGYWHSFFNKITPYDPLYGFYNSYRQIYDDPLVIDISTDAKDVFRPKTEEEIVQDIEASESSTNPNYYAVPLDAKFLAKFSIPYWELYYSFHHPYFVGYLLFWCMVLLNDNYYLGIINFSFKWNVLKNLLNNDISSLVNFNSISITWSKIETRYWRQMSKYRIFYSNPTLLMSHLDCTLDNEIFQPLAEINTMHNYYLYNYYLFFFLTKTFSLSVLDITFILNMKKIFILPQLTNWLTLDLPFPINPYLTLNFTKTLMLNTSLEFYQTFSFSFSRYDSLRENYNFNLFYDWSTGTYLDTINLISYISCFKGTTKLPTIFAESQDAIAAAVLRFPSNKSKTLAKDLIRTKIFFSYHDLPLFSDLALHNLSIFEFFHESIEFLLNLETIFYEWRTSFSFLKFYFKTFFFTDYSKFEVSNLNETSSKISTVIIKKWTKLRQLYFLYNFNWFLPYDLLSNYFTTGLLFTRSSMLFFFFKSFRLWLFTRYQNLQKFYIKVGFIFLKFFSKKW